MPPVGQGRRVHGDPGQFADGNCGSSAEEEAHRGLRVGCDGLLREKVRRMCFLEVGVNWAARCATPPAVPSPTSPISPTGAVILPPRVGVEYPAHRTHLSRGKMGNPDRIRMGAGRTPIPTAATVPAADPRCDVADRLPGGDPLPRGRQRGPRGGRAVGWGRPDAKVGRGLLDHLSYSLEAMSAGGRR